MKVLIVSHAYVEESNRKKIELLARRPGIEFGVIYPRQWRTWHGEDKRHLTVDNPSRSPRVEAGQSRDEADGQLTHSTGSGQAVDKEKESQRLKVKGQLFVRIRNLGDFIPCHLSNVNGRRLKVNLTWPVFGVAPGQSAVFYRQLTTHNQQLTTRMWQVVGGGVIE